MVGFTLAVDRAGDRNDDGSYAAGFFDCEAWDKTAEIIAQYVTKGRQLGIEGRLKLHKWESREGDKRSKVEVVVSRATLIGSRSDGDEESGGQQTVPTGSTSAAPDFTGTDDDIPF